MQMIDLPGNDRIPKLGLGTWYMGESDSTFASEVAAVQYAIERGIRLIDTAEMYANGGAEKVIGAAMAGLDARVRDELFIVSKVLPSHAHHAGVINACEASLKRLGTDCIDLYLLHWCGSVPFQETLNAFLALRAAGKIRHFGVSNFDARDMTEWLACRGAEITACNQILYNLSRRGPEWDLMPLCKKRTVPVMAYSPLEQGRLKNAHALGDVAKRHGVTPLQIALAWVLARDNVIAIPKAVQHSHIDQNIAALDITLDAEDIALLDAAFPPPDGPSHLQMI